jgi:tetratricopeptide (TPR) repeat protein
MVYIENYMSCSTKINWPEPVNTGIYIFMNRGYIFFLILMFMGCESTSERNDNTIDDRYSNSSGRLQNDLFEEPLIEGTSLFGEGLVRPDFDTDSAEFLYNELHEAIQYHNENLDLPETIIWIARKTAAMWRYQDAVLVLSNGIESYPDDPRFYRFRAHYLMAMREFDLARNDMEKAIKLIESAPDQFEPDYVDGRVLEPSSTLHYNIWFNYGLLEYFKGNFYEAATAFSRSHDVAGNADTRLPAADWLYLSYMRAGLTEPAFDILSKSENISPEETKVYALRMSIYRNKLQLNDDVLNELDPVETITLLYAAAIHSKLNNDAVAYIRFLTQIINSNIWAPFSYIAAEADLYRMHRNSL